VAHFHYVLVRARVRHHGGRLLLAAEVDGHLYDVKLANWHFWLSAVFVNLLFFRSTSSPGRHAAPHPGLLDAVRRLEHGVVDRRVRFGLSQLLFVYIIVKCARGGAKASDTSGKALTTRPRVDGAVAGAVHTFEDAPVVK